MLKHNSDSLNYFFWGDNYVGVSVQAKGELQVTQSQNEAVFVLHVACFGVYLRICL